MRGFPLGAMLKRVVSTSALLALALATVVIASTVHQARVRSALGRAEAQNRVLEQQLGVAADQMSDLGRTVARVRQQLEGAEAMGSGRWPFWPGWGATLREAEERMLCLASNSPLLRIGEHALMTPGDSDRLRQLADDFAAVRSRVQTLQNAGVTGLSAVEEQELRRTFSGLLERLGHERERLLQRVVVSIGCAEDQAAGAVAVIHAVYEMAPKRSVSATDGTIEDGSDGNRRPER